MLAPWKQKNGRFPIFRTNTKLRTNNSASALHCRSDELMLACSVQVILGPSMRTEYMLAWSGNITTKLREGTVALGHESSPSYACRTPCEQSTNLWTGDHTRSPCSHELHTHDKPRAELITGQRAPTNLSILPPKPAFVICASQKFRPQFITTETGRLRKNKNKK